MRNHFSIVGIDPSTNYVGMANFVIRAKDLSITDIYTTTINLVNLEPPSNFTRHGYVELYLYNFLLDYFYKYPVLGLAIESAFINKFRISSYGPLTRIIEIIKLAYYNTYGNLNRINEYPPLVVKKHINTEFHFDKKHVQDSIKNSELRKFLRPDMTEHEYDAIAIANLLYKEIKINTELLISF